MELKVDFKQEIDYHSFVIIISGLPGTGKTTLSKKIASVIKALDISTEDIFEIVKVNQSGLKDYDLSDSNQITVYKIIQFLINNAIISGNRVVVNGVFRNEQQQNLIWDIPTLTNQKIFWIELSASEKNVIERLTKRVEKGTDSAPAGPKTYYKLIEEYNSPRTVNLKIDTSNQTPDEVSKYALKEIQKYLTKIE